MLDPVSLAVAGGVVLLLVAAAGVSLRSRRSRSRRTLTEYDSVKAATLKPVLNEAQIRFYNVLRLAVEERYLIFAHVPLWCLINVPMPATGSRLPILSQLALKRATFVLVHPGTRHAEKVLDWIEDHEQGSAEESDPWMKAVLASAGIALLTIRARESYTVADLVSLLDTAEETT